MADVELVPVKPAEQAVSKKERRKQKLAELIDSITARSLKYAAGLHEPEFLADGQVNPKYNPDAEKPWVEASTRTRFSVEVYKQTMAAKREQVATDRTLGVLLLRERMKADEWERHAQAVDEDERNKRAIDVAAEVKP